MKKNLAFISLFVILAVGSVFPQLKEFSIAPMEQPTQFPPIMRSHPDDGVLIIYSSIPNLVFDSNTLGIDETKSEDDKYFVFLKPETQIITVKKRGYIEGKLPLLTLRAKEAKYFKIEDKGNNSEQIPVNIITSPAGAKIYIDDKFMGIKSFQKLPGGVHKLLLQQEGYKSLETTIEVNENNVNFSYTLQSIDASAVSIKSVPDKAEIFLDNVQRGETNKGLFLYPGSYDLRLIKSGYHVLEQNITITENGENNFMFTLTKNVGSMTIQTDPPECEVFINKEKMQNYAELDLAPGKYKVEISKDGYYPQSETIEIERGKSINREYKLTAKTGSAQITVTPLEAECSLLDGKKIIDKWVGIKYLKNLPVGNYELEIQAKGFKKRNKTVAITEAANTSEDITLENLEKNTDSKDSIMVFVKGDGRILDFFIGKFEVTQKEWEDVMGSNPSHFKGDNLPVENVSWNDVQDYIKLLNKQTGKAFRLPTEVEWEFAAKGGTQSNAYDFSGGNSPDEIAWYGSNSFQSTHPVGSKRPNELGIFDMSGNVAEWCQDLYSRLGFARVLRGGSWYDNAQNCRISIRNYYYPYFKDHNIGFRLAQSKNN